MQNQHPITRSLSLTPTITAFESSPDHGRGRARDMRVRWALEEVGQPYEVRRAIGSVRQQACESCGVRTMRRGLVRLTVLKIFEYHALA